MADFILLMHALPEGVVEGDWNPWFAGLVAAGRLRGGSAIGGGATFSRSGSSPPITTSINGFVRIAAADLGEVESLLAGNPVYEAGGIVEVRRLVVDDDES